MDPTLEACLRSWSFDPWLCVGLLATGAIYWRGARTLRRRGADWQSPAQTASFLGGLATILLALVSPLDTFANLSLSVHMIQHLLLMIVAPILLWCGRPIRPLESGLPRAVLETWLVPLRNTPAVRGLLRTLERPSVAGFVFIAVMWGWHLPWAYGLALGSDTWHRAEHASFLLSGLIFWRPVIEFLAADPARVATAPSHQRPYWLLPYLFLADVAGTLLSAVLAFSSRILYPHYAALPPLGAMSALDDQSLAGGLMWVLGSLALLAPLGWIGFRLLHDETANLPIPVQRARRATQAKSGRQLPMLASLGASHVVSRSPSAAATSTSDLPARLRGDQEGGGQDPSPACQKPVESTGIDLLRLPRFGAALRIPAARIALRVVMLLIAAAIVLDGLTGPQVAAMNLAGVLPWVHWRGVAVLALLLLGNFVCMSCPFTLSRSLLRRWYVPRLSWPQPLRNKWLAAALLLSFFLAYEVFDLWASPWWTAWIILGYFAAAALVDSLFRGAAFCKYVCPVGQFQFAQSLISPVAIRARDTRVCADCRTHECLRGSDRSRGCELELFVPRKTSNLDCTLCLACVDACPDNNVGLIATAPLAALSTGQVQRGSSGLLGRPDVAALLVVFVFGAFANALGMVGPVAQWVDQVARTTDLPPAVVEALGFALAAMLLPALLLAISATASRRLGQAVEPWSRSLSSICLTLVPIGVAMWIAHYGFHLLSGPWSFIPAGQRFLTTWGWTSLAAPDWSFNCCAPVADGVLKFEILALDIGLLASLYLGYRAAIDRAPDMLRAAGWLLPGACLTLFLFVVGIWIVFQPMEMRGMFSPGGAP